MKQKLYYLIPLALAVLCLTPFALYKDTVGFSGKVPVLQSLAPSSWRLLTYNVSASISLSDATMSTTTATAKPTNPPLSTGAKYKGFPFGAYFNISSKGSSSSSAVSAWSWLWASVDGLLIIITLLLAIKFNQRKAIIPVQPTEALDPTTVNPLPNPSQTYIPQSGSSDQPPAAPTVYNPNPAVPIQPIPSEEPLISPEPVDPLSQPQPSQPTSEQVVTPTVSQPQYSPSQSNQAPQPPSNSDQP